VKYLALIIIVFSVACGDSPSGKLFTKISSSSSNINFKNLLIEDDEFNVLSYPYFYNGGGVAVGDVNNDGFTDVFFTGNMVKNRLYLNKGNMKFEDITPTSTVADKQGWCTGATMADVNADGWLDIYVCRSADGDKEKRKNLLFINNHDNTFTEQAEQFGIADMGYSTQAAFFDYDKDNDLDLVVINHSQKEYMQGQQEKPGIRQQKNPDYSTHLYRNDNGHYTNVTDSAGITSNVLTFGLGLAVSDLNNDSWPDIYISNDFNEADYCFINQGNGTFKEMSREMFPYTSLFSMGNNASDINNDGLQDLITLDMLPEGNYLQKMHNGAENFDKFQYLFSKGFFPQYSRNMLQINRGDGTFDETGQFSGISNTDWSWAPLAADFNNDGKKDVFISNGYVKDYTDMDYIKYNVDMIMERDPAKQQEMMKNRMNRLPEIKVANYIFCNEGNLKFSNKTNEWGLDEQVISAGAAYADLDNDGDLDIITNNCNDIASVYRNDLNKDSANYLDIQLKGEGKNTFSIGAKIEVQTTSGVQVQEMMPSRGFQSSVDYKLHFGIPKNDSIKSVTIDWPNSKRLIINSPSRNKLITADIKDAATVDANLPSVIGKNDKKFNLIDSLPFKHTENTYNDFTQQVLLPQWFSRQGPALAKGDINGDKLEDVYIGGAKGQAGALFIQDKNGHFKKLEDAVISADAAYEDITAAIFDADGDGDNDLFVGSGGYELQPNDPLLQNRLYINSANGKFNRSGGLPADMINDNAVAVGDFNGDGAIDIFNGGFCVPGKYPEASGSQILINDGKGKFAKPSEGLLSNFDVDNLVTSAAAADINRDGKTDLVIAGHWMGVELWMNKGNHFEKDTAAYSSPHGMYNTVIASDIDGDGDIDIIAGNQGLNNQFTTTPAEPMEMFYSDFDGNGTIEPVISYYIDHKSWPIYSRDDLVQQIPSFNKKFLFFSDYAKSDMNDVFGDKLKTAKRYYASQLQSIILVNNNNKFTEQPLPEEAQWYPVYAIVVTNQKSIITGGNQSYSRIKFGAYGSGRGDVFINEGHLKFDRLPPIKSGLNIKGDIRNAVVAGDKLVIGINNQQPLVYSLQQ
jgi:enediyne biosynthesis protein E4